jgi:cytochrome b561
MSSSPAGRNSSILDNGPTTAQEHVRGAASERYTRVAIVLHWTIAAFIIFNLLSGLVTSALQRSLQIVVLALHISSGMTVLALTVVRVAWRLINDPPPYPAAMKPWERHTAHVAHFLLYAAMVLMPLSGWATMSTHPPLGSPGAAAEPEGRIAPPPELSPGAAPPANMPSLPPNMPAQPAGPPVMKIWNLVPLPEIGPLVDIGREPGGLPAQHRLRDVFEAWHRVGGFLLLGLLILHIAGALKHQFIDRHAELARMWIGRRNAG